MDKHKQQAFLSRNMQRELQLVQEFAWTSSLWAHLKKEFERRIFREVTDS